MSRTMVDISTEPALMNQSFGAVMTFDLPGIAERPMYFGDAPTFSGSHDAAGVTGAGDVMVPGGGRDGQLLRHVHPVGQSQRHGRPRHDDVPAGVGRCDPEDARGAAHQRLTMNIADEHPTLASAALATRVSSDQPRKPTFCSPIRAARGRPSPRRSAHERHDRGENVHGRRDEPLEHRSDRRE
jgi:hypothetical protein